VTFYIAGASSFGRETLDALYPFSEIDTPAVAFLDDNPPAPVVDGVPVRPLEEATPGSEFVVTVANPEIRRKLVARLCAQGLTPGRVIHPRAYVSPRAIIGAGCIIFANTFVSTRAVLGDHVAVFHGANIAHDCVIGDYATFLMNASIAGAVTVGEDVTFGTNACILQNLRVGAGTMIGAGAVVIRDQPAGVTVAGVPSRILR